ncbi:MAG TPA: hypothetical protein VFV17_04920, partial [Usitatibacteraceae bacterium]|nr:hypothetical protein [Usitatibacteraceae bacterium]
MTTAYAQLTQTWKRLHHFAHVQSIVWWDQQALMPAGGNVARSEALAEMANLIHGIRTDGKLKSLLEAAEQEDLDEPQRANLREIRR